MKRLKDAAEPVSYLLHAADALGNKRGPLLFQLPPNMKQDLARLGDFLALLPPGCRAVFEFRHASWFAEETFALLRTRRAAFCIDETEGDLAVPFVSTADWGYLRLRMPEYTDKDLKAWLKQVRDQGWQDAYIFFKHEDEGKGPAFAKRFLELAG